MERSQNFQWLTSPTQQKIHNHTMLLDAITLNIAFSEPYFFSTSVLASLKSYPDLVFTFLRYQQKNVSGFTQQLRNLSGFTQQFITLK